MNAVNLFHPLKIGISTSVIPFRHFSHPHSTVTVPRMLSTGSNALAWVPKRTQKPRQKVNKQTRTVLDARAPLARVLARHSRHFVPARVVLPLARLHHHVSHLPHLRDVIAHRHAVPQLRVVPQSLIFINPQTYRHTLPSTIQSNLTGSGRSK